MTAAEKIKPKDRDTLVQALRAGVVPRLGLRHVQVGRAREVQEIVRDVQRVGEGGSAVRFVIGEYGSGKTFFLHLARSIAIERKLVTTHADLSPDRRLHASGGQARGLCAMLMGSLATRTKPDGGALASIVERFIGDARREAAEAGRPVGTVIRARLAEVEDMVGGYDCATVIERYYEAFESGDEAVKTAALRWLRAEFGLKSEARAALGVRSIVDDDGVYDHLKLMSRFVRLAGYDGLLVVLDEMVNLYKLVSPQARTANYEQILRIVNDVLQGEAGHFGVYFGGTPEFLMDTRRGLHSYEALRSRLAENRFARDGLVDLSGPVLRLQNLSGEELYVLLTKLRHVFAGGDPARRSVPDAAIVAFMEHCGKRIGEAYFRTPRNTIKAFLDLLAVLEQNPGATWESLVERIDIAPDRPQPSGPEAAPETPPPAAPGPNGAAAPLAIDNEMADFRL